MKKAVLVNWETLARFSPLSASNHPYQKTEGFLTAQAGWLKAKRWERKAEIMEGKQSERTVKDIRRRSDRERAGCSNASRGATSTLRQEKKEARRVGKREWDVNGARRCFPSVSELWSIMKKFHGERAESKPEVTEKTSLSQQPSLPSSLHLYLLRGSVTLTLLSLCRPPRAPGSKRHTSAARCKCQRVWQTAALQPIRMESRNTTKTQRL